MTAVIPTPDHIDRFNAEVGSVAQLSLIGLPTDIPWLLYRRDIEGDPLSAKLLFAIRDFIASERPLCLLCDLPVPEVPGMLGVLMAPLRDCEPQSAICLGFCDEHAAIPKEKLVELTRERLWGEGSRTLGPVREEAGHA